MSSFISTPMLDDFARPNEDPLSHGGDWSVVDLSASWNEMKLENNSCRRQGTGTDGLANGMYWTPITSIAPTEVWGCIRSISGATGLSLFSRLQQLGGTNQFDGYVAYFSPSATGVVGIQNATPVVSYGTVAYTLQVGDVCVMRAVGRSISCYIIRNSYVIQLLTVTTSSVILNSGAIGIGTDTNSEMSFGPVGGGEIDSLHISQYPDLGGSGAS